MSTDPDLPPDATPELDPTPADPPSPLIEGLGTPADPDPDPGQEAEDDAHEPTPDTAGPPA